MSMHCISVKQLTLQHHVRLKVFTVMKIQIVLYCVLTPCSDIVGYQCFRGPCYIHLHSEDGDSMVLQFTKPYLYLH